MNNMMGWMADNWLAFTGSGILMLVLLVIYYVLLVRAVLDMLRQKANTALLVFAILGLIPLPPLIFHLSVQTFVFETKSLQRKRNMS